MRGLGTPSEADGGIERLSRVSHLRLPPEKKRVDEHEDDVLTHKVIVLSKNLPSLGIPGRFLSLVLIQPNHA